MNKSTLGAFGVILLALASMMWAASFVGAAHSRAERETNRASRPGVGGRYASGLPDAVRFREVEGRGLLVSAWVNGAGVYTFALDTGAGATILSERVAHQARVSFNGNQAKISGLSGAGATTGREAVVRSLSIGERENFLPSKSPVIVTGALPKDIDGVLDPTEGYWPLGYIIDMPNQEISAFDPRVNPVRPADAPPDGAVAPWLTDGRTRRPFVMLDLGRRALLDTGSGFGLAMTETVARASGIMTGEGRDRNGVRDLGGGQIAARRIAPVTVSIGSLTLRRIPTDLVSGVEPGAPILLGREALQPFHLTFDPANRLIRLAPR
ncbi:MAG: pepsin/retropepsin-like aspartic protease family protein [Pyrinomonadaceae bacterium]